MLWKPANLEWAWLAVLIVALYVWPVRRVRHEVSTGFLWQQLLSTPDAALPLRYLRLLLSLGLQLLILGLLVLALAEPLWKAPHRLVVVVDGSASMNAADISPSRFERARQWLFPINDSQARRVEARLDPSDGLVADYRAALIMPDCPANSERPSSVESPAAAIASYEYPRAECDLRVLAARTSPTALQLLTHQPGLPLWRVLVGVAMLLCIGEWFSFQRQWTC